MTLGLLEVFICAWCSARLSFSLATRHCLGHVGYVLASVLVPAMYNSTHSVKFCFWASAGVLACAFVFAWILIAVDTGAPDARRTGSESEHTGPAPAFLLPAKVWLLLAIGASLAGVTQGLIVILSGFSQRQFGYTNQEGGFLIVILLPNLLRTGRLYVCS